MAISRIDGMSQSTSGQVASAAVTSAPSIAIETVVTAGAPVSSNGQTSEMLVPTGTPSEQANDKEHVEFVSKAMNHFMQMMNADLQFSVHEKTHRVMVKLVDDSTKEVLKEIPSEEFLDMVAKIQEYIGMLVDKKA